MGRKKGAKQKPRGECRKHFAIRLYPHEIKIIKLNGESLQEFIDRCVKELEQQLTSENI
jgi:hypothetical protein